MIASFLPKNRTLKAITIAVPVLAVAFIGYVTYDLHRSYPAIAVAADGSGAAKIARGRYVAVASDCAACHTVEGGADFAGGYKLETPFGTILSSNITQDKETGIGGWTEAQFDRAVRHGKGTHGYLYPAMPYNAYTKLSDRDVDDLWAYMKTIAPVRNAVDENQMPFPFNQRWLLSGWNMLFFRDARFTPDAKLDEQANRGAYLVQGAAHCGSCHTGKNLLGGDSSHSLEGGAITGWYANDLTPNPHTGIGSWSEQDLVSYLKTGTNRHSVASGEMGLAVEKSFQNLSDQDIRAISRYIRSLPASDHAPSAAIAADDDGMQTGKRIYDSQCAACHTSSGQGVRQMIPTLAKNPTVNALDASSLMHVLLVGADGPVTHANPTGAGMPRFDWKLSDEQIAATLTYIRNSWGNAALPVTAAQVAKMRKELNGSGAISLPDQSVKK